MRRDPDADALRDRIQTAILDAIADRPEMVTKWTAVVEAIDEHGKRVCYTVCADDARTWDNLGMLAFALQYEQARAVTYELAEDGGDDAGGA